MKKHVLSQICHLANAKILVKQNLLFTDCEMPDDLMRRIYERDYISELMNHFNGKSTLEEIIEKYGYKLEPLLLVVKEMITQGFLEIVSGKEEQMIVRIRRSLDERSGDLAP